MILTSGNSAKSRKGRKGRRGRSRAQEDFFPSSHVACRRKVKRPPNWKRKEEETNLRRESHLNSRDKKSILIAIATLARLNNSNNVPVATPFDRATLLQVKDKGSNHNKIEGRDKTTVTSTEWY